jgi:hypothetical protein
MSHVDLDDINPIPLTAVVTSGSGGYAVTLEYDKTTDVTEIEDTFRVSPSTVTIDITATWVPTGYWLAATGDGAWTNLSSTAITGVFAVGTSGIGDYDFTVIVTDGTQVLCRHDPRLLVRKASLE